MWQKKKDEQTWKDLLRVGGGNSNRICLSLDNEDKEILYWFNIAKDLG